MFLFHGKKATVVVFEKKTRIDMKFVIYFSKIKFQTRDKKRLEISTNQASKYVTVPPDI